MSAVPPASPALAAPLDAFVNRWKPSGGGERANYALYLGELCRLLDLPEPEPSTADGDKDNYVYEKAVKFRDGSDRVSTGRIDLYRKGCFVLEAKQGTEKQAEHVRNAIAELHPLPLARVLAVGLVAQHGIAK